MRQVNHQAHLFVLFAPTAFSHRHLTLIVVPRGRLGILGEWSIILIRFFLFLFQQSL
jgi:hypothetical protein